MQDKLIDDFKKISLLDKRDVLLSEMLQTVEVIEKICHQKKIKITKLKSKDILIDKSQLYENDFLNLMFTYITYLQEDLGNLLEKNI